MEFGMAAPLAGPTQGVWPGPVRDGVRTVMSFYGANENNDRLFACTADGIWDVTTSTASPTRVYTFPIGVYTDANGNIIKVPGAGVGQHVSFAGITGDHYLAYCDGANGYILYSENSGTWTKVTSGTGVGQIEPTDTAGNPVDPGAFRHVMAWKNRLWFTTENSSTAYYLPVNQFAGQVSPWYFGSQFKFGGSLVGLWNWTVDGGTGIDDLLVGISRGGDVVIYRGTDPTFVETFALQGCWWVGQIPPGRDIASDFGGDLFILSRLGCVPLSKLVAGGLIRDPTQYATAKISNLFNALMTERGHLDGWAIKMHPSDNLMVITVPATPSQQSQMLAMSMATKGWSQLLNIPLMCMESYKGTLWFGTEDGRVCINDGYADGAKLDGTGSYAIDAALLTAYSALGEPKKKRIHMIRPYFQTDGTNPGYSAAARYDFDLSDIGTLPQALTPGSSSWDTGVWDTALWGSGSGTANRIKGTTGVGTTAAIVLRLTTATNCTYLGCDVVFDQGGFR
jgi:hypothetical protein